MSPPQLEEQPVPATKLNIVLDHLRRTALRHDRTGATDAELVECYVEMHDEAAFEALVRRHGSMVLGVCRRVLRNEADAEDAFQATFLVLVRKAGSISPRSMVGNWIYGVAHSTALKAKAMNTRRRTKESEAARRPRREVPLEEWQRLQTVLDEELSRLPNRFRLPIVLCELEGKSIKDAARQLGWPQGTVASRLSRGRTMLGKRIARHDLTIPAGTLAAALVHNTASAALPKALITSTLQAATQFAAGASISTQVATLAEGMVKAMLVKKLIVVTGLLLLAGIAVSGAGIGVRLAIGQSVSSPPTPVGVKGQAKQPPKPVIQDPAWKAELAAKKWIIQDVDESKKTIGVVQSFQTANSPPLHYWIPEADPFKANFQVGALNLVGLAVEPDAQIVLDGKPAQLRDLKNAVETVLTWSADRFTLKKIEARTPVPLPGWPLYYLEAVDLAKNSLSANAGNLKDVPGKLVDLPVAKDADIQVWIGWEPKTGNGLWKKRAKLNELAVGMRATILLSPDDTGHLVISKIFAVAPEKKKDN